MVKNKLSTWLRSGVIEENVKDTLRSTIIALHTICPLNVAQSSIRNSLHDILFNDKDFRQKSPAHKTIFDWFESSSKQTRPVAIFKKTRLYSSVVGQDSSSGTTIDNYNNNSNNDKEHKREPSPQVKQVFSFTDSEQGAVIEPLLNLVEKTFYKFLVDNERHIPLDVVKSFCEKQRPPVSTDFGDADLLCMINFVIENVKHFSKKSLFHGKYKANPIELLRNFKNNVRNKMAHGIIVDEKGRWSDHDLQHVSILACEIVIFLGKFLKRMI